jgi:hypothetical protein
MHTTINNIPGRIFHGEGDASVHESWPTWAFVPLELLRTDGTLDRERYEEEHWADHNCHANPQAVGSHVWPNLCAPLTEEHRQHGQFETFISRLSVPFPSQIGAK